MMLYPRREISVPDPECRPAAFIGGVLALVLTHQTLTVASLVGFVSLGGIVVRNGIMLVTYFRLMREEGEGFTER
jgi:HME family heavy-metal exporter